MKKWEYPKLYSLDVANTYQHTCHSQGGPCTDYNGPSFPGAHDHNSYHTVPNWNSEHFHTCCCSS